MKVSTKGRRELAASLKASARGVQNNLDRERKRSAEHFLGVTIPVTPMSGPGTGEAGRGELRRGAYVDHTLFRDASVVGNSDSKAVYVHELGVEGGVREEAAPINWTTPGTGAKFIESPFVEWKPIYRANMLDAARRGL